ncbi:MAG: hypothetical protein AAF721_22750 [Myxococcota bacterium]
MSTATVAAAAALVLPSDALAHWETSVHEFHGEDFDDEGVDEDELFVAIAAPKHVASHRECSPYSGEPTYTAKSFEVDEDSIIADYFGWTSAEDPVLQHNLANLAAFGFDEYHPISRNSCVSGQFYQQLFDSWAKAQARSPAHDGLTFGPTGDLARTGDILLAFGYAAAHRTWAEATARGFDAEVLADAQSAFQSAAWYALFGSIEQALDEYRWINTALTEAMYPEFQSVAACQGVLVDAGYVSAPEWTIVEPLEPVGPIGPLVPFESPGPFEPIDATWNGGFGLQSYEPLG